MTDVRPDVDLRSLTRERAAIRKPRRVLKYLIPLAILATFGVVVATNLRDIFEKTVDVTVIRPKAATGATGERNHGGVALQAAGWVEPEPFPIQVSTLTSGVIKDMLVIESDHVKANDPVARLVDDAERIAVVRAEAAVDEAKAEVLRATTEEAIARESFDAALGVTENAAAAKARAAGKAAESRHRTASVAGGESDLRIAEEELAIQTELRAKGAEGPRSVELAAAKVRSQAAALEVLLADAALASNEAIEAGVRSTRAARELELRLDDRLRRDLARAARASAEAKLAAARADLDAARLALDRTTIRAPADGVVMERLAARGSTLHVDDPQHTGVVALYDPAQLRIRVDVSQSDLAKVFVGQATDIVAQSRAQKAYRGTVLRIVQRADIQKVTLQVHVRVEDTDALLRPEMLCQVRFHGSPTSQPAAQDSMQAGGAVMVPARVVVDDRSVWVVDPEGLRARRRAIEVQDRTGDWVIVHAGLNVTDKVIDGGRDKVAEGTRVRARGGE